MRSPRRKPNRGRRVSSEETRHAVAALRRGKEALLDIEGQLDSLMALLRQPSPKIDVGAADRLAGATRKAHHAMSALGDLGRLF
jgi:hypothetical protein